MSGQLHRCALFEFECEACGWIGTNPTLDAHVNAWCPQCGRLAEFREIVALRRQKSAQKN